MKYFYILRLFSILAIGPYQAIGNAAFPELLKWLTDSTKTGKTASSQPSGVGGASFETGRGEFFRSRRPNLNSIFSSSSSLGESIKPISTGSLNSGSDIRNLTRPRFK